MEPYEMLTCEDGNGLRFYSVVKHPAILPGSEAKKIILLTTESEAIALDLCDELNFLAKLYFSKKEEFEIYLACRGLSRRLIMK